MCVRRIQGVLVVNGLETRMKVDAHVHVHDGFKLHAVLDGASSNMALGHGSPLGVLMLTEMAGVRAFADMPSRSGNWTIEDHAEPVTKIAGHADGHQLVIIAGHQIVTKENLEVHMLGAVEPVDGGLTLDATIKKVHQAGAITVLPWGFGKWSGARGRLIGDLAAKAPPFEGIFLADSGVRRAGSPRPAVFAQAENAGWSVIAGSDPLPFAIHERAAGRFGFILNDPIDMEQPFASVAAQFRALTSSPKTFGRLERTRDFLNLQFRMQVRKRFG